MSGLMNWYQVADLTGPVEKALIGVEMQLSGAGRTYRGWYRIDGRGSKRFSARSKVNFDQVMDIKRRDEPNLWGPLCARGAQVVAQARATSGLEPIVMAEAQTQGIRKMPTPQAPDDLSDCDADWAGEYSPSGQIGREEAEYRLLRAVRMSGAGQGLEIDFEREQTTWDVDGIVAETSDYYGEERLIFRPTPRDVSDFMEAIRWFTKLNPRGGLGSGLNYNQRLVMMRSWLPPCGWTEIGRRTKTDRRIVKEDYARVIDRVKVTANRTF